MRKVESGFQVSGLMQAIKSDTFRTRTPPRARARKTEARIGDAGYAVEDDDEDDRKNDDNLVLLLVPYS